MEELSNHQKVIDVCSCRIDDMKFPQAAVKTPIVFQLRFLENSFMEKNPNHQWIIDVFSCSFDDIKFPQAAVKTPIVFQVRFLENSFTEKKKRTISEVLMFFSCSFDDMKFPHAAVKTPIAFKSFFLENSFMEEFPNHQCVLDAFFLPCHWLFSTLENIRKRLLNLNWQCFLARAADFFMIFSQVNMGTAFGTMPSGSSVHDSDQLAPSAAAHLTFRNLAHGGPLANIVFRPDL